MTDWPDFVKHAFHAGHVIDLDTDLQAIPLFEQRWGGLDVPAFVRALREGPPDDQHVAICALETFPSRFCRDVLLPFLHHTSPKIRWAAAQALGKMREEEAFPVLLDILQEFPDGDDGDWYDVQHLGVARLIGAFGKQEAVPVLRQVLVRLWEAERRPATSGRQMWWHYQDALCVALGSLGAFEALDALEASEDRRLFWAVTLVLGYLGYLRDAALPQVTIIELLSGERHTPEASHRLNLVSDLLHHRMGWAASAASGWASTYQRVCLRRWEPDPPEP